LPRSVWAPQRRGFNQAIFTAGYTLIGAGLGGIIMGQVAERFGIRWTVIGGAAMNFSSEQQRQRLLSVLFDGLRTR